MREGVLTNIWQKVFTAAAVLALLALSVGSVFAQQDAGQGLEISPPLVELNTDPGKPVTFELRIRNITQSELIAKPEVNDFVAEGEEGQPKLLLEETGEPSPYSIKGWAGPIADLRLAPQEVKTATITLNVPADASPGGHYGVVRFTAVPPELEGTGVALSASLGSLVLVRVSGDITENASIEDFYTAKSVGGSPSSFFEKGPMTFVIRLKNEGNVHFKPLGTIRVTNMLGKETAVLSVNERGGNVLPASVRRFTSELNKEWMFGYYKAEANIQYSGKNLSETTVFWVVPYKLIAIVLGALLVLIAVLRTLLRAYGKRAVKKHESSQKKADKPKK